MASPAGLTCIRSRHGVSETTERLVAAVTAKGMTIFARIDHGAGAAEAGLALRPTALLIFGHARGGTPLMQAAQTSGIDLPLKVLVWQDSDAAVWLGFNEPAWIAERHGLTSDTLSAVEAMHAMLAGIGHEAAGTAESNMMENSSHG
jgi:uncharacterized protein (DUF302 family)